MPLMTRNADDEQKAEHGGASGKPAPLVNVLWTGGYDSSFRMVQLSRFPVSVQPYYLSDNRRSERNELGAISLITTDIREHPETQCAILPLLKFNVVDIEPDRAITEAFQRLKGVAMLGGQYDWLSRFARTVPGLEICLEKAESSKAYNCINTHGVVTSVADGPVRYCVLDPKKSSADLLKIFGPFRFPLPLFEMTKLQMLEEFKRLGFEHVIKHTWFCHYPLDGEPCGVCNPCKSVVEEGLEFRLTPAALNRYRTDARFDKYRLYSYFKRVRRKIVGY